MNSVWADACLALKLPDVSQESDHWVPLPHYNLLCTKLPGCLQQQRSEDPLVLTPLFESIWSKFAVLLFFFFYVCVLLLHGKAEMFCSSFIIYVFGGDRRSYFLCCFCNNCTPGLFNATDFDLMKASLTCSCLISKDEELHISKGVWVISEPL